MLLIKALHKVAGTVIEEDKNSFLVFCINLSFICYIIHQISHEKEYSKKLFISSDYIFVVSLYVSKNVLKYYKTEVLFKLCN